MNHLQGKHILLGITGGIAAYKTADLCSRLKKAGASVQVMMTSAATDFVSAMTFQALSGHPVHHALLDESAEAGMSHIELARWADAILVAPASANTIAKLATGRADNLLTTVCLASEAVKCFAPAMNRVMWEDAATRHNCQTLLDRGWFQFGPENGLQACGESGEGRMQEVEDLLKNLDQCFTSGQLQGLNVMVTAGPTHEPIDPVRYIANRSSGRMGYAIAEAAQEAGASVTLISGPTAINVPATTHFIQTETASDMLHEVMAHINDCHIYISAAAIADYRVKNYSEQKIKKQSDSLSLTLVKNTDILSEVASLQPRPYVIGFAAETENLANNAIEKLNRKKLDMIIANDVSPVHNHSHATGFNSEFNAVHLYQKEKSRVSHYEFAIALKTQLARKLVEHIGAQYRRVHLQKNPSQTAKQ